MLWSCTRLVSFCTKTIRYGISIATHGRGGGGRLEAMFNPPRQKSNAPPWILMNSLWTGCGLPLSLNLFVNLPLQAFFRDSVCHFESGIFSRGETRVRVGEMGRADCTLVRYYVNRKRIFKQRMFVRSTEWKIHIFIAIKIVPRFFLLPILDKARRAYLLHEVVL